MNYKEVIESRYNRKNWQELLYDIFRQRVQFWQQPQPVPVDGSMANRALYTGKITLPDAHVIAIYEVELSGSVDIERNRTGIRNLLCTNWRGMGCSGAFMFCFRKDEAVLRFSYVSEAFAFAEDGSLTKESTDTKRFTYLLGEGHRSRTAIQQFEKLKTSGLTLKDITKAFSVEALSDLFFREYKKQYEDIIEFITGKRMVKVANKWEEQVTGQPCREIMQEFSQFPDAEKAVRDYVKKLMGRLVFIQFLQKKGWMGCSAGEAWNDGDKEFVQNLFANTTHKNTFVDDVLEPLFNDINTRRSNDLANNWCDFYLLPSGRLGGGLKIPYLNGGLFEHDDYDKTNFPLPAKYMKNLLDFFASYNFTIDENDPDDAEIGVDPEMLGRIFENLLEDNKDKGAFYTPKEIVQYMCRESLIAYLQTDVNDEQIKEAIRQFVTTYEESVLSEDLKETIDQKLKDVKICDPAIGSGAFPMGLLRELYACRKAIEGIDDETAVSIKTHIIQNNIYGVDIEKGAVDIARLRFWLALIVDEKNPHALPNMDFKIMQGNSLLEQYEGIDLSGMSLNEQAKKKAKEKKQEAYQQRLGLDETESLENIQKAIKSYYHTDDHDKKIALRKSINENVKGYIRNLKGCTTEIQQKLTNLPIPNDKFFLWHIYFKEVFDKGGFDIVIGNPPYVSVKAISEKDKKIFQQAFETGKGRFNLFTLFIEKAYQICSSKGMISMIIPEGIYSNIEYRYSRELLATKTCIQRLCIFTKRVFEASVDTTVFLTRKEQKVNDIIPIDCNVNETFSEISQKTIINYPYYLIPSKLKGADKKLVEHLILSNTFDRIKDNIEIQQGIIYTGQAREDVFADFVKDSTYKPILDGRDISKWRINWDQKDYDLYLSYTNKLHRPREERLFLASQKILFPRRATSIVATIDYDQFYALNTAYICLMTGNKYHIEYILAILNSRLVNYLYSKLFMGWQITIPAIDVIPIAKISIESQETIKCLVEGLLSKKKSNPLADTTAEEREIDRLVYDLYGLTEDEIAIVEGTN